MTDWIILDLGEYGEILVEPARPPLMLEVDDETGLVQASRLGDAAREAGEQVRIRAEQVLKNPLTGLAKGFMAALPDPIANEHWQLNEFSAEFQLGFEAQVGTSAGVVATIGSNGSLKCTYTWKPRSQEPNEYPA